MLSYKCLGRKKYANQCEKTQIPKDYLEEFILESVIKKLSEPTIMDSIVETLVNLQDVLIKENSSLKTLTSEKMKVDNALRNLVSAIEQGIISNTTNKRLHELEKQQEDLERQIIIERSKATVKLTADEIREFYEQALDLEPKMLVNFLIKEIVLYNDRIEVFVNNPLKVSPDDSQGFSLYKGVANLHHRPRNKQLIENVKMKIEICIG